MEEQRHRQEEDARKVQVDSIQGMETDAGGMSLVIQQRLGDVCLFASCTVVMSGGEISGGVLAQAEETDLPYNPVREHRTFSILLIWLVPLYRTCS